VVRHLTRPFRTVLESPPGVSAHSLRRTIASTDNNLDRDTLDGVAGRIESGAQ